MCVKYQKSPDPVGNRDENVKRMTNDKSVNLFSGVANLPARSNTIYKEETFCCF